MIINYNSMASNALRQLNVNTNNQAKSMAKLSSGLRINSAADDAAGLTISEKMKGQIRGLNQASRNAQDGQSLVNTAEGALSQTTDILQRMRELAVQGSNDTNTATDRDNIQKEMNQLTSEINRIGNTTQFNSQNLLDGSKDKSDAVAGVYTVKTGTSDITIDGVKLLKGTDFTDTDTLFAAINSDSNLSAKYTASKDTDGNLVLTQNTGKESSVNPAVAGNGVTMTTTTAGHTAGTGTDLTLQIGANQSQSMDINIADMRSVALGISTTTDSTPGFASTMGVSNGTDAAGVEYGLDLSTSANASSAITTIDNAINQVSSERSKLGAYSNRLDNTVNNLNTSSQNTSDAQARIADVDMAGEMMNQSKQSVLAQAAQAMLAQANQQPQQVLQLLRG